MQIAEDNFTKYGAGIRVMRLQANNKVVEIFSDDDEENSGSFQPSEDQNLIKAKG